MGAAETAIGRRAFIKAASSVAAGVLLSGLASPWIARAAAPFRLPPLPYPENALAPAISANTIGFHYGKHHRGVKLGGQLRSPDTPRQHDADADQRDGRSPHFAASRYHRRVVRLADRLLNGADGPATDQSCRAFARLALKGVLGQGGSDCARYVSSSGPTEVSGLNGKATTGVQCILTEKHLLSLRS
jgi:Iron/manganese superoxide dismutases, alpha-hairpin domain